MIGSFKLPVPATLREIEMGVDSGFIVWRYVGDAEWIQLVALETLTGADGADGANGADGAQGIQGETGATGATGADGEDGTEIELSIQSGYLCWRYVGDVSWTQLYQVPTYTTKGTGAEVTTGTDDAKYVTPKAIKDSNVLQSTGSLVKDVITITQSAYDALGTKVSTTLYLIIG